MAQQSVPTSTPILSTSSTMKDRKPFKLSGVLFWLLLLIFTIFFLTPVVWLFLESLKSPADLGAYPIRIFPAIPQWQNFWLALRTVDFLGYTRNTLFLSLLSTVLTTITSAMVGFGFARLYGPGKNMLFLVMLSTIMLPQIMTIIPSYVIFARLSMINTYWPWVLWGLASSPFMSFLFRQFFSSIPQELEDAAIVDGAGYLRMFWQIFMPLSIPVVTTCAILTFTYTWGDYLAPSLYLDQSNTTLSVILSLGFTTPQGVQLVGPLAAGTIFYVIPVIVIFFFAQRYFTRGIVTTGIK